MTGKARQVAVVAVRGGRDGVELCLIRRKDSEKWKIPKGFIDPGERPEEAALKEALEEAGIEGRLIGDAIGTYDYNKGQRSLTVAVYVMEVVEEHDHWQEAGLRDRWWRSLEEGTTLLAGHPVMTLWDRVKERLAAMVDRSQARQRLKEDAYRLIRVCSSSLDEAAALLDAEPSLIDARTGIGETPLHYLAVEDHLEGVRFLHQRGASIDVTNDFDETPLKEALSLGNAAVAGYLLDHNADVHRVDNRGESTLHAAARGGNLLLAGRILAAGVAVDSRDNMDETPLCVAIREGDLSMVEALIAAGADINLRIAFEETPLHVAADHDRLAIARSLLKHGADPTARHEQGRTPAEEAESHGFAELAALLAHAAREAPRQS